MKIFLVTLFSVSLSVLAHAQGADRNTQIHKEGEGADGTVAEKKGADEGVAKDSSIQRKVEAIKAKIAPEKKSAPKILGEGVIGIGKNKTKNIPRIQRYDSDADDIKKADVRTRGGGVFFRGEAVSDSAKGGDIKYVYISRGAWMVKSFQPYIDRLAMEVLKEDRADLVADFVEVTRSFSHLCLLIASDDGSPRMLRTIASGIASHREAISLMKLHWAGVGHKNRKLLNEYIERTFLRGISPDAMRIDAGSQGDSRYKPLKINEKIFEAKEREDEF